MRRLLVLALTIVPAVAKAEAPLATATVEETASPTGVAADPNADRGFLLPTAQTQPKGTVAVTDYDVLVMGLTYGITDNLQVTATALPPLSQDVATIVEIGAKLRVLDLPRLKLAAQAGYWYMNLRLFDIDTSASWLAGGPIATVCIDAGCDSSLSASLTWLHPLSPQSSDDWHAFIYGANLQARVIRHVKLLAEVDSSSTIAQGSWNNAGSAVVGYGVRFFGAKVAGDVGFLKQVGSSSSSVDFALGIPFVSLTVRL